MATNLGPQCSKLIFEHKNIQNGNPRDDLDFLTIRGMGYITGFQQRLFPHSNSRRYLRFHFQNQSYQLRALPFGLSTAPMEFICMVKEVKLMAQPRSIRIHQYLDDWLIWAPTKEPCHQGTQSLLALCQEFRWVVNLQKSELEPKTVFWVCGLQVRSLTRTGQTDPEPLGVDSPKGGIHSVQTNLPSQKIYVPDRPSHSNRKTGTPGEIHMRPIQ